MSLPAGTPLSLSEQVLQTLSGATDGLTAIRLSKAVGRTTAKEVNPTIYALQRAGKVETTSKDASKPIWSLVSPRRPKQTGVLAAGADPTPVQVVPATNGTASTPG